MSQSSSYRMGQRVHTEHGAGRVVAIESYNRISGGTFRFGVALDVNPFFYPVAYFWPDELSTSTKSV